MAELSEQLWGSGAVAVCYRENLHYCNRSKGEGGEGHLEMGSDRNGCWVCGFGAGGGCPGRSWALTGLWEGSPWNGAHPLCPCPHSSPVLFSQHPITNSSLLSPPPDGISSSVCYSQPVSCAPLCHRNQDWHLDQIQPLKLSILIGGKCSCIIKLLFLSHFSFQLTFSRPVMMQQVPLGLIFRFPSPPDCFSCWLCHGSRICPALNKQFQSH